jgi:hypothetical protein
VLGVALDLHVDDVEGLVSRASSPRTTSAGSVLLCDHRLSGLWLPTGGHVESGEHPLEVRWWTVAELRHVGLGRFEPRLLRALDALRLGC